MLASWSPARTYSRRPIPSPENNPTFAVIDAFKTYDCTCLIKCDNDDLKPPWPHPGRMILQCLNTSRLLACAYNGYILYSDHSHMPIVPSGYPGDIGPLGGSHRT